VPSRELVNQVFQLFKPICSKLDLRPIRMFGSSGEQKKKMKIDVNYFKGKWFVLIFLNKIFYSIVITTPGRFDSYIGQHTQLKSYLKFLEVLIIDEADKFKDQDTRKRFLLTYSFLTIYPYLLFF
jgi:superfamily II DNA/RNA helicase